MKKITLVGIFLILLFNVGISQEIYKRVEIPNADHGLVHKLQFLGLDLTCGTEIKDKKITLELYQYEIDLLEEVNIPYNILIEDMTKFYVDRAKRNAPKAVAELKYEHSLTMQFRNQRSFSVGEILNNVGQYNECEELDWSTPLNWNLNPFLNDSDPATDDFGGCLTYDMVLQELDDMRTYSVSNGLNIISEKLDTSVTPSNPSVETTTNGNTVYYIRISDNPDVDESGEPELLYTSLVHSRESTTVMNQLYFMWYILENYNSDPAIQNLVNNHALYFIPVFNPDGFEYNEAVAPNGGGGQRKNRNLNGSGSCSTYAFGIDLNRNSGYFWDNGGSSANSCSSTYMGSSAFSETETQIMRDFFLDHDFELTLNHHSFKNAMLHAYAGVDRIPGTSTPFPNSRADEYSKYNHDMTEYNRYAHGPSTYISSLNSGNMNDWMLGGANYSYTGSQTGLPLQSGTGSGKNSMAWTPENGSSAEGSGGTYGGFWPNPSNFVPIAKRAMRMNFLAAYFSGKYGKVHDLNQNDITATSGNLSFAIENLGQAASDFTVTVTAVSNINIPGATNSVTESFSAAQVLEQRTINIPYTLPGEIQANDKIEFKVVFTNDYASDNVLYEANIIKAYTPNVIFAENADPTTLGNWTSSGSWTVTTDAYQGSARAIKSNSSIPYSAGLDRTLQLNSSLDFTNMETVLIQYHAKWDLERSFDYVALEASTDGTNWSQLCGKLTKPGAPTINNSYSGTPDGIDTTSKSATDNSNQNSIDFLYDGDTQDHWNMEEIVIDASSNISFFNEGTVFLRFRLDTDSNNRKDSYENADFEGFTFDNFKVIEMSLPCDNSLAPTGLSVSNITATTADVTWNSVPSATYDLRYRPNGTSTWTTITDISGTMQQLTGLDINTEYEVQVATRCSGATSPYSSSEIFTTLDPCINTISSFPYSEGFESNSVGLWSQATNAMEDDIDWTVNSGGTASTNTGPSGAASGTYYIYTEASSFEAPAGSPNKTALLTSPCIDFTGYQNAQMTLDYHMYGSDIGTLSVEVSQDFGATYSLLFSLNGQQPGQNSNGSAWLTSSPSIDLSAYDGDTILIRLNVLTGADFNGDISVDNINITADVSSTPPTAVCQDITVQLDSSGSASIVATDIDNGSSDDVGITNYSIDVDTFSCSDVGSPVSVTLTVEDAEGQSDTCTATVTVEDNIAPDAQCQNITIQLSGSGTASISGSDVNNGSSDACGIASLVVSPNSFDCADIGNNDVTLTVTDTNGNSDTCIATVTVQEITDPVPDSASLDTVTAQCSVASITAPTATDNCDGTITATTTTSFPITSSTMVVWTYTDTNGNDVTQNQTVTINDTTDPIAVCQDITILLDGTGNASITATDVDGGSTDNCAITSLSIDIDSFNTSNIGTNNVVLTVTDSNGNTNTCIAVVTVEDDTLNLNDITLNNATISPNPFGSSIIVTLPLAFNNSNFDVKIFDLNSRVVYSKVKSVSNGRFEINGLDNLEQALYFISIYSKLTGTVLHKKLIKHE